MLNISKTTFATQMTPEQFAEETKKTTKEELEKLSAAMKNHLVKKEKEADEKEIEEDFLVNSDDDIEVDDDSTSTSSSTNKLIDAINKNKKQKKNKKSKLVEKKGLIQSVIMIEKLKGEISKLESRIRYKDLDMSNLQLEIMKLNEVQDKFKLITNILTELQNKEIQIFDCNQAYKNINMNQSHKLVIFQLEELLKKYETMKNDKNETNKEIVKLSIKDSITKLDNPIFSRLILDKQNLMLTELNNQKVTIYNQISFINQMNDIKFYSVLFVIGVAVIYNLYWTAIV
jgi:hypothetical protein